MATLIQDQDSEFDSADKQLSFVTLLKKYPCLLEKSQIPSVKAAKSKAAVDMLKDLQLKLGLTLTVKTLLKKINNMKTKIKTKTDVNETGNRKIILVEWEKQFLGMLQPDKNPTFCKIPGALSSGLKPIKRPISSSSTSTTVSNEEMEPQNDGILPPPNSSKRQKSGEAILKGYETEETSLLSNMQLQRLVLLEQLNLIRIKKQRFSTNSDDASEDENKKTKNSQLVDRDEYSTTDYSYEEGDEFDFEI